MTDPEAGAEDGTVDAATNWTADEYQVGTGRDLLPQHHARLIESGISIDVARARGYWSAVRKSELHALGFGSNQQRVPALVIPVHGVTGEVVLHQVRPDDPRRNTQGKPVKYETPSKARMALDVPPVVRPLLGNPSVPLVVTEGARKADSAASAGLCCIAVAGVWNWRGSNQDGGSVALADWEHIALNDRAVLLAFDSDVTTKPPVQSALLRLKAMLEKRHAHVQVIHLPSGEHGEKVGLDDFLATGHDRDDVLRLATPALPRSEKTDSGDEPHPYREEFGRLFYEKPTRDGSVLVLLCNFTARIVAEVIEDDGAEQRRLFQLAAQLKRRTFACEVAASQFATMTWVTEHLGAEAIVDVGLSTRDHTRAAIQYLSGSVPRRSVFTHTGWRQIGGEAVYLHSGGGVGVQGAVTDVETRLDGGLTRFALPVPPDGDELQEAVRASLALLDAAPEKVTTALLAMIYRAPLGQIDFSGFLVGPSGAGKSELAALAQQHFGHGMDRLHLPASWSSTANALEAVTFQAKDALLVIDDFAPTGTASDVLRLHREAERLLRAQGNASSRMRMRADTTLRPPKPPRGLLLGTGEDVPRGQSLRARLLVIEVGPGDVHWDRLGRLQELAAGGVQAAAMAGYLRWLAPTQHDEVERVATRFQELRQMAESDGAHRRTPAMVANLAVGFERFLQFATHVGAIDEEDRRRLWGDGWHALVQLGEVQSEHIQTAEPTTRFLELLQAALAGGDAHVAAPSGEAPESAVSWGWRQRTFGSGDHETERWEPQGQRIGWLCGGDLYLEPNASFAVCQRLGQITTEALTINQRTLERRLHERGLLASIEVGRGRHRVRRRGLEGQKRPVLHLLAASVFAEHDPGPGIKPAGNGVGPGVGPVTEGVGTASGPKNGHPAAGPELENEGLGPVGPVGPLLVEERVVGFSEDGEEIVEWRA